MTPRSVPLLPLLLTLLCLPGLALGEEGDGDSIDPQTVTTGDIYLKSKAEFARCEIDGKPCEASYDPTGQTLILEGVDRTVAHPIKFMPIEEHLGEVSLTIQPKDFKLLKLSKTLRTWRAEKTLRLPEQKKKAEKPKKEEAPKPPPPAEDEED